MASIVNDSPKGEDKDTVQGSAADASVAAADNGSSSNDTPPTSSQTSPTAEKSTTPAAPPNGGLQAWLHILGSFFLYFNTWGEYHIRCGDVTIMSRCKPGS